MKFPGRRHTKHYFPVTDKGRTSLSVPLEERSNIYVVGIDQLLVDIEIEVSFEFLEKYEFAKGQSFIISDELCDEIYYKSREKGLIRGEYPSL